MVEVCKDFKVVLSSNHSMVNVSNETEKITIEVDKAPL